MTLREIINDIEAERDKLKKKADEACPRNFDFFNGGVSALNNLLSRYELYGVSVE